MKRSKREENGIIIHFIFYTILFIIVSLFFIFNIYPSIVKIENKKEEVKKIQEYIKRIEKEGFTFIEFKSLNSVNNDNSRNKITTEILKSMTPEFYNKNLVNTGEGNYKTFLGNIRKKIESEKKSILTKEKEKQIIKILPTYSDNSLLEDKYSLTDFKFINYIESILQTFSLTSNKSIGISNLNLLEEFSVSTGGESLDSDIYYIPLSLSLNGTKEGIIDFLYFARNVGNIKVLGDNIILNDNDGFLFKNGVQKVLEGDKLSLNYNILENQIFDINKIRISKYIDSKFNDFNGKDFISTIKKNQGQEEFNVEVELYFYVKGQNNFIIKEYIDNVFLKYTLIRQSISKKIGNKDLKGIERINLIKYNNTLKQIDGEVQKLRKILKKEEKISIVHKRVIELDAFITPIYNKINK